MSSQALRQRRPEATDSKVKKPDQKPLLHDQVRRGRRAPWAPSFSLAVRILFLIRVSGAMYSNIDDCDEVYNFWEPLHLFAHGYGFETWELSPAFALRSWAYVILHYLPSRIGLIVAGGDKRASLFAVRIFLAAVSTLAEAAFYRAVVEKVHVMVGRYLFLMLAFSAGMWKASTALLPSSFAMYATTVAYAYAIEPSSLTNGRKALVATLAFATGAIVGWPFALALAFPFVFEELFVFGNDRVTAEAKQAWLLARWKRMILAVSAAALIFIPVVAIDSIAYGKVAVVPWNIIRYNIFGGAERGPELYGTEPWTYYISNLVLNFNLLTPMALLSLPALGVTYLYDRRRLGYSNPRPDETSPFTITGLRLAPFYLWIGILTLQPHKEERFMFPAYPLLCFNAALCIYLVRGWLETLYIKVTKSQYQASKTVIFSNFTFSILVGFVVISGSRICAEYQYYHAPISVAFNFQTQELPRLLNVTGLLDDQRYSQLSEEEQPRIDLGPIRQFNLTLCYGKEWHRFPGNFLVPTGINVEFIKSEFSGLLPTHFAPSPISSAKGGLWPWPQTHVAPAGLNDLNIEEPSYYVDVQQCDYLVDLDFPKHPVSSPLEPRYAIQSEVWERVYCEPFLDARHSMKLSRILWFPGKVWQMYNEFGDYCILKNKDLVRSKELRVIQHLKHQ
ncbi:asparagine-linked glycosylation 9 protein isoform a [Coprinopsis cinerea okayama7|uniref:Mannosyltransferase n=1 Tax=Coprinopsis cinerea (strain Okayama-7 / 130 / ATCC MYA-4618 / FGSC 9003) TaxID=240176 RepID=A8N2Q9_COPC7|nr:asparagine-linked glycosylation 9 protein isoform a [Coprinopsis cinerea okayama7\|eukprot:XP_001829193.2 asparagine-linked glycosylation 9 protein isoform a [Coprinopsis cinerea okayama7\